MPQGAPARSCDLVMKGGITSGVVYPKAVAKLARQYRLANVGGTSAGAIAAALAAAAEHGRGSGGIEALDAVPEQLGAHLKALFVPSPRTRRFHRVLMAAIDGSCRGGRKLLHVAGAAVVDWPWAAAAGALAALVFPLLALWAAGGGFWPAGLLLLPVMAVGVVAGAVTALTRSLLRLLPGEGYGVYSGLGEGRKRPGFTDWIGDEIDRLAGLAPGGRPLTFGDLWGQEATAAWRAAGRLSDEAPPVVNLEVMTSDLTHGLALRVPFTVGGAHAFCPAELASVLPPRVLAHLEAHAQPAAGPGCRQHDQRLLLLPPTPDLPVVLAVRLSMSFPLLIAAVPLWRNGDHDTYEKSWFSDGGISSNFPVHFFDRLWPRHPTFAIDLQPTPRDGRPFTPPSEHAGDPARWLLGSVLTFVRAVFDTMQNWNDRGTAALPGYRDRVTRVHLEPGEGGINLAMTDAQINRLARAGADAVDCFLPGRFPERAHRLVRFDLATAKLQSTVGQLDTSWVADGWQDLVGPSPGRAYVEALLAGHRHGAAIPLTTPKPEPDLRLTPHF